MGARDGPGQDNRRSVGSNEPVSRRQPISPLYKEKERDFLVVSVSILIQLWEIKYP